VAWQPAGQDDGNPELGRKILQSPKRDAKVMEGLFGILTEIGGITVTRTLSLFEISCSSRYRAREKS
jgi:hypothetical protein